MTPARSVPAHIPRPPYVGQRPQEYPDINHDPIHVLNKDQIEGLRAAAKIAAATLKHALENTKVTKFFFDVLDRNETRRH